MIFPFDGLDALANLFSNGYEEIIYRGLMLLAIGSVTRKPWFAILLSSMVFGMVHTQYGYMMRTVVALGGLVEAWTCLRTRSLWSPWTFHMVTDILVPLCIGPAR